MAAWSRAQKKDITELVRKLFQHLFSKKILNLSKAIKVFKSPLPSYGNFSVHIYRGPYLAQVFPDPGEDASAVLSPGGSRNLNCPLHHFVDSLK